MDIKCDNNCFICLEYLLPVVRTSLCSSLLQIIDLNGILAGSRGSRHSADSGTTSDSTETKDNVFDETASPFRSSLEMSPPVSPSTPTPPFIQKGAYISKAGILVFTFLWLQFFIWLWLSVHGFFLNSGNNNPSEAVERSEIISLSVLTERWGEKESHDSFVFLVGIIWCSLQRCTRAAEHRENVRITLDLTRFTSSVC